MSISKQQKINQSDLLAIINSVNTELGRRGLATITPPSAGDNIDDTNLDLLASKIAAIRTSHCYCQSNGSMTHSGCPSYTNPSLDSTQVDEGVLIVASETTIPDVLDVQADLAKLVVTTPCQPQCACNNYCSCYGVSNLADVCPSQCNCDLVCDCEGDCSCAGACNCEDVCSCVGVGACTCDGYTSCGCDTYSPGCDSYTPCTCAGMVEV